jgi:tRNA (guanine37-N1)-methyltransferase
VPLKIDFVTLFPEMVLSAARHSILLRAEQAGHVAFGAQNPRDFATDAHRSVDDKSYGGGPGMVMMAPIVDAALQACHPGQQTAVVLLDPTGERFEQRHARELAGTPHVIFLCGHYEGMDERIREKRATHVFSLGDFVLTGGELPALVMADATVRLLPGVLGDPASHQDDSHEGGLLGFPLYTRPPEWEGLSVPPVLLSGDHGAIAKWRRAQQLKRTQTSRPDLLARAVLSKGDADVLSSFDL